MVTNTEDDDDSQDAINYKAQYRGLKRKLKFLIYENECFQEALRSTQRRLLKASRDRSFLLDRLLNYEKVEVTSSEGEETESSDDGEVGRSSDAKKRKLDMNSSSGFGGASSSGPSKAPSSAKKKKPATPKPLTKSLSQPQLQVVSKDGHMTSAEVQRHLEARQQRFLDQAVASIPAEMFSNDPSLDIDSESNELCEMETSPSNLGEDCLSVDMIAD